MKLYNRTEFMKLPEGTIFAKGKEWYFEDIRIKCESICHGEEFADWYEKSLNWVDAQGTGEAIAALEDMKENGVSYPMQDIEGRDGCYDEEDLFLVYEKPDLEKLKEYIQRAIDL